MKKTVCSFAVLAVFAMVLTGLSPAQEDTYRVSANIPFDFYAGDIHIPSGNYLFKVSYGNHSVTLRNQETGRSYVFLAEPGDGNRRVTAVLDFDVIANHHLLADLKTSDTGVTFRESKPAMASAEPSATVTIVAELR